MSKPETTTKMYAVQFPFGDVEINFDADEAREYAALKYKVWEMTPVTARDIPNPKEASDA